MKRFFTALFSCILVLVVVTLLLSTASLEEVKAAVAKLPSKTHCSGWMQVSSPSPGHPAALKGVAAASANDVWAVGYYATSTNQTLIEHWNGTGWQVVTSPSPGSSDNQLFGVAVVAAKDAWAVGDYSSDNTTYQTLIEHWNGTSWKVVPSPNPGSNTNVLNGVAVTSANGIWAVGDSTDSNNGVFSTLIEHWDGTSWKVVPSPSPGPYANILIGVSVVSANDGWAVGTYEITVHKHSYLQTLTEHWDGSTWSFVPSPNHHTWNKLYAVAPVAGTKQVWAVGSSSQDFKLLTERWDGQKWSIVPIHSGSYFGDVLYGVTAAGGPTNAIAVGYNQNQPDSPPIPLVEQWNGSKWQVSYNNSRGYLAAVTSVPGSKTVWAVGLM